MIEYRNLYWDAPDHSRMQAEIKHPDFGWIPYCCMEGDTGIGAELWAARAYLDIEEWRDRRDLEQTRREKIVEINTAKNYQLNNGGLEYEEDLFAYDDGPSAHIRYNPGLAGSDLPRHRSAGGYCTTVDLKGKPRTRAKL